jgi:hypothetical protein
MGLAGAGRGEQFGREAHAEVYDEWDTLATGQARGDALLAAVNRHLAAAGVLAMTVVLYDGASPKELGGFNYTTWTMHLDRLRLEHPGLTRDDAALLAQVVYHEARHAHQHFMIARLLAGQGYSAAGIAGRTGIPAHVATAAKSAPIKPGTTEAVVASGFHESNHGSGAEHRRDVLTRLNEADWALVTAQCRCNRNPTEANQALLAQAKERRSLVHDEYRDMPQENDAFAVGIVAEDGVTRATSNPVPIPDGDGDPCEQLEKAGRPAP